MFHVVWNHHNPWWSRTCNARYRDLPTSGSAWRSFGCNRLGSRSDAVHHNRILDLVPQSFGRIDEISRCGYFTTKTCSRSTVIRRSTNSFLPCSTFGFINCIFPNRPKLVVEWLESSIRNAKPTRTRVRYLAGLADFWEVCPHRKLHSPSHRNRRHLFILKEWFDKQSLVLVGNPPPINFAGRHRISHLGYL